jgi:hypothetical protein
MVVQASAAKNPMSAKGAKILTPVQAAEWIYDTKSPTTEQIGWVVAKIESGQLRRSSRGGATTTADAIAEYLARRASARGAERVTAPRQSTAAAALTAVGRNKFSRLYRGLLEEYFLAVLLRRRVSHQRKWLQWAVSGTHAVLLVVLVAFVALVATKAMRLARPSPEETAIMAWLNGRYQQVRMHELKRVESDPQRIVAAFDYFVNGRRIQSKVYFRVQEDKVISASSDF